MIHKGDIVSIRAEWREPGEEKFTFVARNDEEKGRVDISALELSYWTLWPMQTVRADMIEPTGRRLEPDGTITHISEVGRGRV